MATQLGVRGCNPIWMEVDLDGNLFDDTFYLYVLENTLPYIPADVYHDPNLNVVWNSPIQFLGNGTLPVDIYFIPGHFYRLEFRKNDGVLPPSQSDPLIYEVNNYMTGTGSDTPIDTIALASSNQITNPQFALINFSSPHTLTNVTNPAPIDIGPGWELVLTGTGNVTISRIALNSASANPTNAPYALRILASGWNSGGVVLRQRFQQNGMLWANKTVSTSITARVQGPDQFVQSKLVDSQGGTTLLMPSTAFTQNFAEKKGHHKLNPSTNTNIPPDAYIDYRLELPPNIEFFVSSIQLVVQEGEFEPTFEQDSIERQIDHTFHNYYNQLLIQPKDTILTGWDFSMNPWQFRTFANTNLVGQIAYTADQTIVRTDTADSVQVGSFSSVEAYYFSITARNGVAQGQIATIQYIDTASMYPYWNNFLSALVRVRLQGGAITDVKFKMRLIWRVDAPPVLSASEPIVSYDPVTKNPVFSAGWTAIAPINDPEYSIGQTIFDDTYAFNGFQLPRFQVGALVQYLGVVVYTTNNLSSATPDRLLFHSVSLMPNEFAIDVNAKTFNQTLEDCRFYYEKSYANDIIPGTPGAVTTINQKCAIMNSWSQRANEYCVGASSFELNYSEKRTIPALTFYSPSAIVAGNVYATLHYLSPTVLTFLSSFQPATALNTFWAAPVIGTHTTSFQPKTGVPIILVNNGSNTDKYSDGSINYHFVADARLGLVI